MRLKFFLFEDVSAKNSGKVAATVNHFLQRVQRSVGYRVVNQETRLVFVDGENNATVSVSVWYEKERKEVQ